MAYDVGRKRTAIVGGGRGFLVSSEVDEWRYFVDDPSCSRGPP
jgi:hypothetical protein